MRAKLGHSMDKLILIKLFSSNSARDLLYNENPGQPSLLLVGVDVQEGAAVTFDIYANDVQAITQKSEYGPIPNKDKDDADQNKKMRSISIK